MTALLCVAGVGAVCALLLPSAMALAPVIGAVDLPGDARRMHHRPTPRCGGMAMFAAFWSVMCVLGVPDDSLLPLLGATALLLLLGLADDVFGLPASLKLAVQVVASVVVAVGMARGAWGVVPITLYLCLVTNAHNMIDGLDGLCGSVVALESGTIALLLWLRGDVVGALLALGVLGCCLGYLPYNAHPARVFMGDEGALFLGFFVGVLSLRAYAAYERVVLLPLLCLLPLTDLTLAVLRRVVRGQHPFRADRGHLHHRLCDGGLSPRACVLRLLLISLVGALTALIVAGSQSFA